MKLTCAAAVFLAIVQASVAGRSVSSGVDGLQGPPRAGQPISASTTAIMVDAVVRDRNQRLVTDLSAADFELFEDGERQTIDSFTRVSHGGGIGVGVAWKTPDRTVAVTPTAKPEPPAGTPLDDGGTVALVYDPVSYTHLTLPTILRV